MGSFAFTAGIGRDLYVAAYRWLGKLPGGIALATMATCAGFGTCSGSAIAAAATMGDLCYPEMVRLRYKKGFSAAAIAAGSTLEIIIPPSNTFIIYGFITDVSIGALFAAGMLPGLLLCLVFMLLIIIMCKINPRLGGMRIPKVPPAAMVPEANLSLYRNFFISGRATVPNVTTAVELEPVMAASTIRVMEPALDSGLADMVDWWLQYQGVQPVTRREDGLLGGEPAEIVEGQAERSGVRAVFALHEDKLYALTFYPVGLFHRRA